MTKKDITHSDSRKKLLVDYSLLLAYIYQGNEYMKDNTYMSIPKEWMDEAIENEEFGTPKETFTVLLDEAIKNGIIRSTKKGRYAASVDDIDLARDYLKENNNLIADNPSIEENVKIDNSEEEASSIVDNESNNLEESVTEEISVVNSSEPLASVSSDDQEIKSYSPLGLIVLSSILVSLLGLLLQSCFVTGTLATIGTFLPVIGILITIVCFILSIMKKTKFGIVSSLICLFISAFLCFFVFSGGFVGSIGETSDSKLLNSSNKKNNTNSSSLSSSDSVGSPNVDSDTVDLTEDEIKSSVNVEFGDFITDSDTVDSSSLEITITNISDTKWTYNFCIQAVDKDGNKIGEPDYIIALELEPEEVSKNTIFQFVSAADAEKMKSEGITFEVTDVSSENNN